MKAYKVLQVCKNRLFSYNPNFKDIERFIKKQKPISVKPSHIIEYKSEIWNTAKRTTSEDNLFIFKNIADAESLRQVISPKTFQVWEVDVDSIIDPPEQAIRLFIYPQGTYFCKKLKLVKRISG